MQSEIIRGLAIYSLIWVTLFDAEGMEIRVRKAYKNPVFKLLYSLEIRSQ